MKKESFIYRSITLSFLIGILLISCFTASCSDAEKGTDGSSLLLSFKVKAGGQIIEGVIDENTRQIVLGGIENGNLITDVEYGLAGGAMIYPDPQTRINSWQPEEKFVVSVSNHTKVVYSVVLPDFSEPKPEEDLGDAVIYPQRYYGKQIKDFFFDLKLNASGVGSAAKANELFVDDDMNGIRISIYGEAARPAHPEPGKIDEQHYTKMIASVNRAKTARGSKELTIFASKKLDGKNSFPDWVKDANGIIPEKYGILLVDYILYMKQKGIIVDVLGVDNETTFNEGNITPQKHAQVVDYLRTQAAAKNFKMPLIVGPDQYEPLGDVSNNWVKNLLSNGWGDKIDIYGTHYYPEHRYYDKLKFELSLIGERPFWATEPHWSNKETDDRLDAAEDAICALWDQTDLGMDAFMWWDYQRAGSIRGCLMRAVSVPLRGACPVEMDDHDGKSTLEKYKLQTRAFRKGDEMIVYAINMSSKEQATTAIPYDGYEFGLNEGTITDEVTYTRWTDDTPVEGTEGIAAKVNEKKFAVNLPSRSITCFRFTIKM